VASGSGSTVKLEKFPLSPVHRTPVYEAHFPMAPSRLNDVKDRDGAIPRSRAGSGLSRMAGRPCIRCCRRCWAQHIGVYALAQYMGTAAQCQPSRPELRRQERRTRTPMGGLWRRAVSPSKRPVTRRCGRHERCLALGSIAAGLAVAFTGAFAAKAAVVPGGTVWAWMQSADAPMGQHASAQHSGQEELSAPTSSSGTSQTV
jgi:hypothetical protein